MLAALQASDLQNGFADIFKRLNPAEAAPEAIDALLALAEQLKALGTLQTVCRALCRRLLICRLLRAKN